MLIALKNKTQEVNSSKLLPLPQTHQRSTADSKLWKESNHIGEITDNKGETGKSSAKYN